MKINRLQVTHVENENQVHVKIYFEDCMIAAWSGYIIVEADKTGFVADELEGEFYKELRSLVVKGHRKYLERLTKQDNDSKNKPEEDTENKTRYFTQGGDFYRIKPGIEISEEELRKNGHKYGTVIVVEPGETYEDVIKRY